MYKLIALDCDGTLLNDHKEISPKTLISLKNLKNIQIVLTTSKPFFKVKKYLEELNLLHDKCYTISFNGGLILENNGYVLHKDILPTSVVQQIVDFGRKYDLYTFIYEEDRIIANEYCDNYIEFNPDTPYYVADFTKLLLTDLTVHKIIIHGDSIEVGKAKEDLEKLDIKAEITSSNIHNIEFIPLGNSKTKGLECLSHKLNISPKEMIAFGDNENDLDMFNYVGYKVAMGNGIDALKKEADLVTTSNNEDGIALALNKMHDEGTI